MSFVLRDYQEEFCDAVEASLQQHGSALGVLATGLGKTVCFTHLMDRHPGRCLMIAPMIELIDQAADKIRAVTGETPAVERAEFRSPESVWARSKFVVASKQTLTGKGERHKRLKDISLVVYDEAHTAGTAKGRDLINYYRDQGAQILGVTATPNRNDGRSLGELFAHCAYEMGILDAIRRGWLCKPLARCVEVGSLDLSTVSTHGSKGDFVARDLGRVMQNDEVCLEIAAITAKELHGDKTIVFCASVDEAEKVADALVAQYKIDAAMVCSDQRRCSIQDRKTRIAEFRRGNLQVLTNVGIVTTGVDVPDVAHIVMARPTKSTVLYTQCIGRATRPLPGIVDIPGGDAAARLDAIARSAKPHFRITDLVDASRQHKLVRAHDALAGVKIPDDIQNLLDKGADKGDQHDVMQKMVEAKQTAIEAKQAAIEARKQAAEFRRSLMTMIEVDANYTSHEVDLFIQSRDREVRNGKIPIMPFGKHKGWPMNEVPTGYLSWLHREGNLRDRLRNAVSRELLLRRRGVTADSRVQTSDAGLDDF